MVLIRLFWTKVPVLIRSLLTGIAILMAAVYPWSALMQMNLSILPQFPWSVAVGGMYLWLLWRYVGGWGYPSSNAGSRNRRRRFHALPDNGRNWIWIGSASLGLTILAYGMIKTLTESVGAQQTALFDALAPLSGFTVAPMLLGAVIMTGFFEEAAFRGYMQLPIEERHGPVIAIIFVAVVFTLVHSPQPMQLPLFIFGSCGWGVLTYLSGSILPAVIFHALVDGVVFFWAWQNPVAIKALLEYNVLVSGGTNLFTFWLVTAIIGTSVTIFSFFKIYRLRALVD